MINENGGQAVEHTMACLVSSYSAYQREEEKGDEEKLRISKYLSTQYYFLANPSFRE